MNPEFSRLLDQYGQIAEVFPQEGGEGIPARAFLQPLREKREAALPSPLGIGRRDRFLYLGDPEVFPGEPGQGIVRWNGRCFDLMNVQAVYVGNTLSHWWAVLSPRDEEAQL